MINDSIQRSNGANRIKTLNIVAAVAAASILAAGSALAQSTPKAEPAKPDAEKVHHAGGRHDQRLHEAAERARANGRHMQQTTMHAGGRHDVRAHEAAMKAEAERVAGDAAR